ncbi:MAG: N-acetyltransferase [Nitrospirales bacterium]|nr:MAG: N-acetyltransferase [Nitrospirales bacterium]
MSEIPVDTILLTERLRLRVIMLLDVEMTWSATRYDGFNDGMIWDRPKTRSELVDRTQESLSQWKDGSLFTYTVELVEPSTLIGRVAIKQTNVLHVWNIGFWIHPDFWGQGYATEATRAVLDFGFSSLHASKIVTAHAIWNIRSKRVIEKLGFRYTGENPCGFRKQGNPVAEYEYEIDPPVL